MLSVIFFLSVSLMASGDSVQAIQLDNPEDHIHFSKNILGSYRGSRSILINKKLNQDSQYQVMEIQAPSIQTAAYALQGEVAYELSGEPGYLELVSFFPGKNNDHQSYFTRSMAEKGALGQLKGTKEWRPFILPFYRNASGNLLDIEIPPPNRLILNVIIPDSGVVALRNIELVNLTRQPDLMAAPGQWWPQTRGSLVFGLLGTLIGVLGGVIGYVSKKPKAQFFIDQAILISIGLGSVFVIIGVIAAILNQPYHVVFPLLLTGCILLFVFGLVKRKRFIQKRALELRRMDSFDL